MEFFKHMLMTLVAVLLLSGCATSQPKSNAELSSQENILLQSKNYTGLIKLYRGWLKDREDPAVRLKLARYYYQTGDYTSSLNYLQPLALKPDVEVYQLQAQNMVALGDYSQALRVTDRMLQKDANNAEAYNLRGIALSLSGKLQEGEQAIKRSRALFIADDIAVNNLAMTALLDRRYQDAVDLLLPQYLHGHRQPRMLHNLVLALVKVGNTRYADYVIRNEKLSSDPNRLIAALELVGPLQIRGA